MPEDPKPSPPGQGTQNPAAGVKPPDSLRAGDLEAKKHSVVGDVRTKPQPLPRDDRGQLISDPRPNESAESKRIRKEHPAAPGTSGLQPPADPRKAIEIADRVLEMVKDEDHEGILEQVQEATRLNKTVARAAQLRKRPDPDVEYPTTRLDPKLKDSDAQERVRVAALK